MSSARSVCTGCARGCNTFLDYLNDVTYRYRPRENEAVNQEWMCDDGRAHLQAAERRARPRGARGARARRAARRPGRRRRQGGAGARRPRQGRARSACCLSPAASLEDLLVAATVAKEALGAREAFVGGRADGWQDDFLKRADQNPNRKGLELVAQALGLALRPVADLAAAVAAGKVKAIWAVGAETPDEVVAQKLAGAETLVVQAYNDGVLAAARDDPAARRPALGDGRHLRQLRGARAALRDGVLPARRGAAALGARRGPRARARARPALRGSARRVRRARRPPRRRPRRLPLGLAPLDRGSGSASSRSPRAPSTGGSRATATACRPTPPRTTGAASRGRRRGGET